MMKSNEREQVQRIQASDERYRHAAVEVARMYGVIGVDEWDDAPAWWRRFLVENINYTTLIQPLVWRDRGEGLSWRQLANRYGVSQQTVRTILSRAYSRRKRRALHLH